MQKVTAVASLTRVQIVVNHTMPTPLQKSTKLKSLALIFSSVSLPYQDFILWKTSWASIFSMYGINWYKNVSWFGPGLYQMEFDTSGINFYS